MRRDDTICELSFRANAVGVAKARASVTKLENAFIVVQPDVLRLLLVVSGVVGVADGGKGKEVEAEREEDGLYSTAQLMVHRLGD